MKKQFKIIILLFMCLTIIGIYLGKNIYYKNANSKEQVNVESQKEKAKDESAKQAVNNKPSLLEFSTET